MRRHTHASTLGIKAIDALNFSVIAEQDSSGVLLPSIDAFICVCDEVLTATLCGLLIAFSILFAHCIACS